MNENGMKSVAPAVRDVIRKQQHIPKKEMDNNVHFNPTFIFAKNSPYYLTAQALVQGLIDATTAEPPPDGLTPPLASGNKREKISRRNVETLLANIYDMRLKNRPTLSFSLRPDTYSNTKLSGSGIINLVKLLAHFGYLTLKPGFRNNKNAGGSRLARVKPNPKFWRWKSQLLDTLIGSAIREEREDAVMSEPYDLIELRRTKVKIISNKKKKIKMVIPRKQYEKEITKEQKARLWVVRESIRWFNLVLADYKKTYTGKDGITYVLNAVLKAIYSEDFGHGGRFYTGRGGHQGLSKDDRKTIRFNGHPTIELDFGGLHIRMLYHLAGGEYPLNKDPYAEVLRAMGQNPAKVFEQFPGIRDDLKVMLLALVNGVIKNPKSRFKQAINRAQYRLFNDWCKYKKPELREETKKECEERKERWVKAGLLDCKGKPSKVVRAFRKAHSPIRKEFSTGCGLYLQNLDATIAFLILCEMMFDFNYCVPVLPLHDSFITFGKKEYRMKLRATMKAAYRHIMQEKTGRKKQFKIPVKPPESGCSTKVL